MGQTLYLCGERRGGDLALGGLAERGQTAHRIAGDLGHERAEFHRSRRVDLHLADSPGSVIPGGSGSWPVAREHLIGLQDLLRHAPRTAGGLMQAPEVAARICQAIGVIHA